MHDRLCNSQHQQACPCVCPSILHTGTQAASLTFSWSFHSGGASLAPMCGNAKYAAEQFTTPHMAHNAPHRSLPWQVRDSTINTRLSSLFPLTLHARGCLQADNEVSLCRAQRLSHA